MIGVRVIIYGTLHEAWMKALSADAPVWKEMPQVKEVLICEGVANIPPASCALDTVLIPTLENDTLDCPREYRSLIPDQRAIATFLNKALFATYAEAMGLGRLCPPSYVDARQAEYPCVLKRTDLHSGFGTAIVESLPHLQAHLMQPPWRGKTVVLQRLVKGGTDYVTHCVCKDGAILWHCTFAFQMDSPASIRTPRNSEAVRFERASTRALAQIGSFLRPLRYTGPCNADYKLAENGDIVLFEINARFGGSLMRPQHVDHLREALCVIIERATIPA